MGHLAEPKQADEDNQTELHCAASFQSSYVGKGEWQNEKLNLHYGGMLCSSKVGVENKTVKFEFRPTHFIANCATVLGTRISGSDSQSGSWKVRLDYACMIDYDV